MTDYAYVVMLQLKKKKKGSENFQIGENMEIQGDWYAQRMDIPQSFPHTLHFFHLVVHLYPLSIISFYIKLVNNK